ncbi:hypothetical protein [Nostoc sp. CHAB 5715]|uniref:hypothetical protein n=1 Tax=Nostoc sp. CHAB 5715 TaxID=2780400 RepID=UPI001E2EA24D|nr:hypothetical protein [Nostoc sp. CHAB 5715]MCC5619853.1 hypothetical protein [Nostoc sp. CHAB 5715]
MSDCRGNPPSGSPVAYGGKPAYSAGFTATRPLPSAFKFQPSIRYDFTQSCTKLQLTPMSIAMPLQHDLSPSQDN